MFVRRINGRHPLNQLRDEMDRVFENFSEGFPGRSFGWRAAPTYPALNIWEDEHSLYAEAELPGLKMEDLELLVVGNELTVKGQRKDEQPEGTTYHRRERGVGSFSRVVRLPIDIDADKVEATLKDGVLLITLPKAEKAKPRKVQVKALTK
jgi:HSP20 family protein